MRAPHGHSDDHRTLISGSRHHANLRYLETFTPHGVLVGRVGFLMSADAPCDEGHDARRRARGVTSCGRDFDSRFVPARPATGNRSGLAQIPVTWVITTRKMPRPLGSLPGATRTKRGLKLFVPTGRGLSPPQSGGMRGISFFCGNFNRARRQSRTRKTNP